jgi:hypothetical protein
MNAINAQVAIVAKEKGRMTHCHVCRDIFESSTTLFPASNAQRASGMRSMGIPWRIFACHALKVVCVELRA